VPNTGWCAPSAATTRVEKATGVSTPPTKKAHGLVRRRTVGRRYSGSAFSPSHPRSAECSGAAAPTGVHPRPKTLNAKPYTLNAEPLTLNL